MATLDTASLTITGAKAIADLTDTLTAITEDAAAGSVAQLSLTVSDNPGALLSATSILATGASITWRGRARELAAFSTRLNDDNALEHTFSARSTLARKLRSDAKTRVRQNITPSAWVTAMVKAAGGKAVCQPSNARAVIGQRGKGARKQTTLDVIANLASDLGWSWCERDGLMLFGSRWWAWGGLAVTSTWPIALRGEAVVDVDLAVDADDTSNAGSGQIMLAYDAAADIQPWDRLRLTGAGIYDGDWLIEKVKVNGDPSQPVEVDIAIPRKPVAKKARTTT